jgi:uncharacterized double-CXXCG motif protein
MHYFRVKEDKAASCTGHIDATHQWTLPGLLDCPACKVTWGDNSKAYPSVDLGPVTAQASFEDAWPKPIEEYERSCELVRPFLPPGAVLEPGAAFGPLVGKAQGRFGSLAAPYSWWLLVQREALEKLQAEGLRGLKGCPTQLRFRQRASPVLLELELLPVGRAHPECLPPHRQPPCPRCHRHGLTLPKPLVLDGATLPHHLDVFRLEDFSTVVVCTERFAEACQRLGLDGVAFHPLPTR